MIVGKRWPLLVSAVDKIRWGGVRKFELLSVCAGQAESAGRDGLAGGVGLGDRTGFGNHDCTSLPSSYSP